MLRFFWPVIAPLERDNNSQAQECPAQKSDATEKISSAYIRGFENLIKILLLVHPVTYFTGRC